MDFSFTAFILSIFGVIFGGYLAFQNGALTPNQMLERGLPPGNSFLTHGGMWGDFLFIPIVIGILIGEFQKIWTSPLILAYSLLAIVTSIGLHLLYVKVNAPSSHVFKNKLTPAGWVHLIYMAGAFVPIFLFYFGTPAKAIPSELAISISVILAIHITFGTHIPLKLMWPEKCEPVKTSDLMVCGVSWLLLGTRTWFIISTQ